VRTNTVTGVCASGTGLCWRDMPGGAIDIWNRDIAGDGRQQWVVIYDGTNTETGCPISGPNQSSVGVYSFIGFNAQYAGAGYNNGGKYWVGDNTNSGSEFDYWAWSSNGELANCGDSQQSGGVWAIPSARWSEGNQLYTVKNPSLITAFQQINV